MNERAADKEQVNLLKGLDYSVLQQCMHCGMCLPTCPTYSTTLQERSSPRGRIAMMRAIADDRLAVSSTFAEEMYFCLGCLACQTACPAGVDYNTLFENARAEVERVGVLANRQRNWIRSLTLKRLFVSKQRLWLLGRFLYLYQRLGLQWLVRRSGVLKLLPQTLRQLEPLTPVVEKDNTRRHFERRKKQNPAQPRYRVALLSGCVQDLTFASVNDDTIAVLQENDCQVLLPQGQECCGSLHGHNGEVDSARHLARINIDAFAPEELDAIIVNAGGCGSHMMHYDRLLADDPAYAERAALWSAKVRDIHQFLVDIEFRAPRAGLSFDKVTYHESCHLKHGQKVASQPLQVLQSIPGLEVVPLTEADWCCGSAGIYNITQPDTAMALLDRKMGHIEATQAQVVTAANTGCTIQLEYGCRRQGIDIEVRHPVSLLAAAYRAEQKK